MIVRVPATSANLGPGFDVLGLALTLYVEMGLVDDENVPDNAQICDDTHPGQVAFVRAGGQGRVWVKNAIPMARGMGFSGAVRVGGVIAAEMQTHTSSWSKESSQALQIGTELEGHPDNVAPSVYGGVVIVSNDLVVPVPMALDPVFVMWVPEFSTSTNESRGKIGSMIALSDAVFNMARTAMLVTAFQTGDVSLLKEATKDRIHQDIRFDASPSCRDALQTGIEAGAWCGWLSGSGPTVALMCDSADADQVASAVQSSGQTKLLRLDTAGAVVL
ncbi:MAG: homoserine kinase [Actinomycetota bacterium]